MAPIYTLKLYLSLISLAYMGTNCNGDKQNRRDNPTVPEASTATRSEVHLESWARPYAFAISPKDNRQCAKGQGNESK